MKTTKRRLSRFFREELAVTTTEYAVMIALIAVIAMKTIQLCGEEIRDLFLDTSSVF